MKKLLHHLSDFLFEIIFTLARIFYLSVPYYFIQNRGFQDAEDGAAVIYRMNGNIILEHSEYIRRLSCQWKAYDIFLNRICAFHWRSEKIELDLASHAVARISSEIAKLESVTTDRTHRDYIALRRKKLQFAEALASRDELQAKMNEIQQIINRHGRCADLMYDKRRSAYISGMEQYYEEPVYYNDFIVHV